MSDLHTPPSGIMTVRSWGTVVLVLSLASLIYFEGFFETAPPAKPTKIGEIVDRADRVHNIGLLNQQQNGVITSCTGVIAGILILLLGEKTTDTGPTSGAPRRLKGGIECPRCRTISPEGTRKCDCGFVFA